MGKTTKIIIALVVVAVLAAGAVLLFDTTSVDKNKSTESDNNSELADEEVAATINYTSDGFSPASVTVSAGSVVRIVNQTDEEVEPSSNPHPDHNGNPELNFGDIEPSASKTATLTKTGTWGYHNHYHADHKATIIVQ